MTFKLSIFASVLFLSQVVFAATESEISIPAPRTSLHSNVANINEGNIEISGTINLVYTPTFGSGASLNPAFRYFFTNRLSAGLVTTASFFSEYNEYGAGPSLAYYFLHSGQWAFFVGQDLLWSRSSQTYYDSYGTFVSSRSTGKSISHLGANFFITKEVAAGPTLSYQYPLGEGAPFSSGTIFLSGQFSLYF